MTDETTLHPEKIKTFGRFQIGSDGRIILTPKAAPPDQKSGWSEVGKTKTEGYFATPYDQQLVINYLSENVSTILKPNSRILDLATGSKSYLPPELSDQITGVDLSTSLLKNNDSVAKRVVAIAQNLPFKEGSFDVTLNTFMMRYLSFDDQITALVEMIRVTKPGGKIVVIDFDAIGYSLEVGHFSPTIIATTLESLYKETDRPTISCTVNVLKNIDRVESPEGSRGNLYSLVIQL